MFAVDVHFVFFMALQVYYSLSRRASWSHAIGLNNLKLIKGRTHSIHSFLPYSDLLSVLFWKVSLVLYRFLLLPLGTVCIKLIHSNDFEWSWFCCFKLSFYPSGVSTLSVLIWLIELYRDTYVHVWKFYSLLILSFIQFRCFLRY